MSRFRQEVTKVPLDMDEIFALLEKLYSPEREKLIRVAYDMQFWEQIREIDVTEKEIDTVLKRLGLPREKRRQRIATWRETKKVEERKLTWLDEQVITNPIRNDEQLTLIEDQVTIDIVDDNDDVGCSYAPRKKWKQSVSNDPDFFKKKRRLTIRKPIDIKKKRSRISTKAPSPPNLLPDITFSQMENIVQYINGVDLKLVIGKKIFDSDCETGLGRLSIPINQVVSGDFLTEEEKAFLDTRKSNGHKEEIRVKVFDTKGIEWPMSFSKWDMFDKKNEKKSNPMYVLVKEWNLMMLDNELKVDDLIELWSFRKDSNLFFGLL